MIGDDTIMGKIADMAAGGEAEQTQSIRKLSALFTLCQLWLFSLALRSVSLVLWNSWRLKFVSIFAMLILSCGASTSLCLVSRMARRVRGQGGATAP